MVAFNSSSFRRWRRETRRSVGGHRDRQRQRELAHDGIDAQPCPLVRFQIGDVAGQQISALTELGILQRNQGSPHGRYGFIIVDDQLLLLHGRIRMHDGQHGACSDEHGDREADDKSGRACGAPDARHRYALPAASGR